MVFFDGGDEESDFPFFLDVLPSSEFFLTLSFPNFSSDVFTSSLFAFMALSDFFFFFLVAFAILSSPKIFCIIISNPEDNVSFTTMTLGDLGRLLVLAGDVDLFSGTGDIDDFPGVGHSLSLVSKFFSNELSFSLVLGGSVC